MRLDADTTERLRQRFMLLSARMGFYPQYRRDLIGPLMKWADRVIAHYSEPHRQHHALSHIAELYSEFELTGIALEYPDYVEAALWFHDVIYDPRKDDNEEESVKLMRAWGKDLRIPAENIQKVAEYIRATEGHERRICDDCDFFLDMDLATLGKEEERFGRYEEDIRSEYSFVPLSEYLFRRVNILKAFDGRNPLYRTSFFRSRYEKQAHKNLSALIARLEATPTA